MSNKRKEMRAVKDDHSSPDFEIESFDGFKYQYDLTIEEISNRTSSPSFDSINSESSFSFSDHLLFGSSNKDFNRVRIDNEPVCTTRDIILVKTNTGYGTPTKSDIAFSEDHRGGGNGSIHGNCLHW